MSLAIRKAQRSDVPLILTFIRDLAAYEKLEHEVVATAEALDAYLFGSRPAAEVLIGECDGEPAGFALFFQTFSTFLARPGLYLEDLFVRQDARNRGLGRELLSELARIAVERDCGRLEWSVLDWNEPAIAFYRRLGAVPMQEWTVNRLTGDSLIALAKAGSGVRSITPS